MTEEELKAIEERLKSGLGTFVSDRADVAAMAAEIRRLWFVNAEIRRKIGYQSKGTI